MSAPLAQDPKTGSYFTADATTGDWRPINDAEVARIRPTKALDEMGVSGWERFAIKNFMNPGTALMFLRARGYDALPYGDGLNFAVRRAGSADPWKLVDPQKGGVGEFLRDMLDLSVGDVALPAAGAALGAFGATLLLLGLSWRVLARSGSSGANETPVSLLLIGVMIG